MHIRKLRYINYRYCNGPESNPAHMGATEYQFQLDDAEFSRTFSTKFDFIHTRCMTGCIKGPGRLFPQAFEYVALLPNDGRTTH